MKEWFKRYFSVSAVVALAFMAFVLFFNDNSVSKSYEYASEIRRLEERISQYEDTLRLYQQLNRRLDSDPQELERIVREQYHMQRPSEDVYIFD